MVKKYSVVVLSALLVSGTVLADLSDLADIPSDVLVMDGDEDTMIAPPEQPKVSKARGPMRTSFFTGVEYGESVYEYNGKGSNLVFVIADGGTRISENWRLRYILSEQHAETKGLDQDDGVSINYRIAPRYSKWVNPNFSYFIEPSYYRRTGSSGIENTEWQIKPGMQYALRKHIFFSTLEYKDLNRKRYARDENGWKPTIKEDRDFQRINAEVNYTYRQSTSFNWGLNINGGSTLDNADNVPDIYTRSRNYNIKPFVRLKHFNNITTEVNLRWGRAESGLNWGGSDTTEININNNMQLNRHLRLIANIGYRQATRHTDLGWGDSEGLKGRVGLNISF
ncbi:hypothetical protein VIN01S_26590 [Vibrio inusitatus NBRC 102082]|uniref:Uncharacterized protein n=1 Tax=Vibrio inusitatus NBRC 102082 TaxID=1219070 RepID=A0A4Y3HXU6_9VIBR|nr:hypothetical protein [Vibrio inusitatus]GEA51855.1 hypothetical protein VIN01S_26590 [Vibrio inusitatus NBRC 102082]